MKGAKRFLLAAAVVVVLMLGSVGIAYAVTGNPQPDGDGHPYVGMVALYDTESGEYLGRCSGSLLSPTVFLTAGHCTDGADLARVWFEPDLSDLSYPYPDCGPYECIEGTPYTHPGFCIGCAGGLPGFDTHDVGIVVLSEPVTDVGFAALPTEGLVDTLAMMTDVDLVGYGVQWKAKDGGIPPYYRWTGYRTRFYAPVKLVASNHVHSDEYVKLTANPAQGKGGTCFGDSGGPDLLGGTNIVLAVNSYVTSANCTGVTYSNRIDTEYALEFINDFLD
jgi:hypothetical protein